MAEISAARARDLWRRPKNRLLSALPADEYRHVAADLRTMPVHARQVLQKQGEPPAYVYFPNGGVCSITTMMTDGTTVEAVTIGDEGIVGLEASLSCEAIAPGEALMQVPDTSVERLPVDAFRRAIARGGVFAGLMHQYALLLIAEMTQLAACNVAHEVDERCCRWLLMTDDRMHQREFRVSQELLATLLGVRRQTVTVVARSLQSAGLIRYSRGLIRIVDRAGLEAASCECYAIIRGHFDRLCV